MQPLEKTYFQLFKWDIMLGLVFLIFLAAFFTYLYLKAPLYINKKLGFSVSPVYQKHRL